MRAIVSVFAKDSKGITAYVASLLAGKEINILDISQTLMQEFFTMSMLVETEKSKKGVAELAAELDELGKKMGLAIHTQREDIFTLMHRV